jgi:hypothetical protein
LLVSLGDCVSIDSEIAAGPLYEANRSIIIWVHLIVRTSFVIGVQVKLCFEGEVAISRFGLLVTFDVGEERDYMHGCTGVGYGLDRRKNAHSLQTDLPGTPSPTLQKYWLARWFFELRTEALIQGTRY